MTGLHAVLIVYLQYDTSFDVIEFCMNGRYVSTNHLSAGSTPLRSKLKSKSILLMPFCILVTFALGNVSCFKLK